MAIDLSSIGKRIKNRAGRISNSLLRIIGINPRSKPVCDLSRIPRHILIEIIEKVSREFDLDFYLQMNPVASVRMRRTCQVLNKIIEEINVMAHSCNRIDIEIRMGEKSWTISTRLENYGQVRDVFTPDSYSDFYFTRKNFNFSWLVIINRNYDDLSDEKRIQLAIILEEMSKNGMNFHSLRLSPSVRPVQQLFDLFTFRNCVLHRFLSLQQEEEFWSDVSSLKTVKYIQLRDTNVELFFHKQFVELTKNCNEVLATPLLTLTENKGAREIMDLIIRYIKAMSSQRNPQFVHFKATLNRYFNYEQHLRSKGFKVYVYNMEGDTKNVGQTLFAMYPSPFGVYIFRLIFAFSGNYPVDNEFLGKFGSSWKDFEIIFKRGGRFQSGLIKKEMEIQHKLLKSYFIDYSK